MLRARSIQVCQVDLTPLTKAWYNVQLVDSAILAGSKSVDGWQLPKWQEAVVSDVEMILKRKIQKLGEEIQKQQKLFAHNGRIIQVLLKRAGMTEEQFDEVYEQTKEVDANSTSN